MSGPWRGYVDIRLRRLLSDEHYEDATAEEIVDLIVISAPKSHLFPAFERRKLVQEVIALRREAGRPEPRPTGGGRLPATSLEDVEQAQRDLVAAGEPSGERAIAARLGVSRGAVRHALGKDRRPAR